MQIQKLLPSFALLLAAVVSAQDENLGYVAVCNPGISKREAFPFMNMEPRDVATRPIGHGLLLNKRQSTCPPGTFQCQNINGCCDNGTVCGIYGGEEGCCKIGKRCDGVRGCSENALDCGGGVCCVATATCGTDSNGLTICVSGGGGGSDEDPQCAGLGPGYHFCDNLGSGCCPQGVECIPPANCAIKCTPSDPRCGKGCCSKGMKCNLDETCSPDNGGGGGGDFTPVPSNTITQSTTIPELSSFTRMTFTEEETTFTGFDAPTSTRITRSTRRTPTPIATPGPDSDGTCLSPQDGLIGAAVMGVLGYMAM